MVDWWAHGPGDVQGIVAAVLCSDDQFALLQTCDRAGFRFLLNGAAPKGACQVVLMDVVLDRLEPVPCVSLKDTSRVEAIPPCHTKNLSQVTELCCGTGAFSTLWSRLQFHVKLGVDHNPNWQEMFQEAHPGADFLAADAGSVETLKVMHDKQLTHGVILAGVSCQPYSRLGDQGGMADSRSSSLDEALMTTWCTQSAVLVLECVAPVLHHKDFQAHLQKFCQLTGYHLSQQVLDLKTTWCTRRERWIGVLTAPALGKCVIPPLPRDCEHQVIRQVMPYIKLWPSDVLAQIQLNRHELEQFAQHAVGGPNALNINLDGVLPTSLHSIGNQLTKCACGCRGPLSSARIKEKGLLGVLIPLDTIHPGTADLRDARYPHPAELYLLNGGDPCMKWPANLKLGLGAVGQCVSPLVGLWIASHVSNGLATFLCEDEYCDPEELLNQAKSDLLASASKMWPSLPRAADDDDQMLLSDDTEARVGTIQVSIDGGAPVSVAVRTPCTVGQIRTAEMRLRPDVAVLQACTEAGSDLADMHPVEPGGDVFFQARASDISGVGPHSQDDPCEDEEQYLQSVIEGLPDADMPSEEVTTDHPANATAASAPLHDPLLAFDTHSLLRIACPVVTDPAAVDELRQRTMTHSERIKLIQTQGSAWADDQVKLAMELVAQGGGHNQNITVMDPPWATGMTSQQQFGALGSWIASLPENVVVITAVVHDSHWVPMMWRFNKGQVQGFISVNGAIPDALHALHSAMSRTRVADPTMFVQHPPSFLVDDHCGAWVVSYMQYMLHGTWLPSTAGELEVRSLAMIDGFIRHVGESPMRPWIWGTGDQTRLRLESLLSDHGVPTEAINERIAFLFDKLGESRIAAALKSNNPWRELKWVANQAYPKVQLIKPSELQKIIDTKAKAGVVGNRSQKRSVKGKGKGKTAQQVLDPSMLKFDSSVFQSAKGAELNQLEIAQISSSASGVVLATPASAAPYLQSTAPISVGSLAIVVLCVEQAAPQSVVKPTAVQIPVRCKTTDEALLVAGFLYNLGSTEVVRFTPQSRVSVEAIESCVVKLLLYRDQCQHDWSAVRAHPVRVLLSMLPVLVKCQTEGCQGLCECWHAAAHCSVEDPVLEIWSKQWLTDSFGFTAAADAAILSLHVRIPMHLQTIIQTYSGQGGLYVEPKAVTGKGPSSSFQVIWLQHGDHQQALLLKQTRCEVLGLARLGSKFGLRCRIADAEKLHSAIKPDSVYLPTGPRLLWQIGPLPYGTVRASLAQALRTAGWAARPVQALPGKNIDGMLYKVQSVEPPPSTTLAMTHGDVVVTRLHDPVEVVPASVPVIGSARAVSMLSNSSDKVDFLQIHDPWAGKSAPPQQMPTFSQEDPVSNLEDKITAAVMSRLEQGKAMEVDSGDAVTSRVTQLEAQMNDLALQQVALGDTVRVQASEHTTQIQQLQAALQSQNDQLARTITQNAAHVQEQMVQQERKREEQLQTMFGQQMEQFEALLAKRPRME